MFFCIVRSLYYVDKINVDRSASLNINVSFHKSIQNIRKKSLTVAEKTFGKSCTVTPLNTLHAVHVVQQVFEMQIRKLKIDVKKKNRCK